MAYSEDVRTGTICVFSEVSLAMKWGNSKLALGCPWKWSIHDRGRKLVKFTNSNGIYNVLIPRCSMYGLFTYTFTINLGHSCRYKYQSHWASWDIPLIHPVPHPILEIQNQVTGLWDDPWKKDYLLRGCPGSRKWSDQWVISQPTYRWGIPWGYSPLTNLLLTSWGILGL